MIWKFFVSVIVLTLALSALSCEKDDNRVNPRNDHEDEIPVKAPYFKLKSLEGDSMSLDDTENKVVVLFFFGHSCAPCRTAAVSIETRLRKPYEGRDDYALLGMEASNGNTAAVSSFRSLTGVTFPLLMNASHQANAYETTIDRLIIVNRSGYIHHKSNLAAGCDLDDVAEKIGMMLADQNMEICD
ncbi:MAG: TlpA disulfide reductase family protein [Bacteroidales bacterium]